MNVVEFRNVFKSFNGNAVLDDLSFSVEKGDIFAIVGPSGTGKSVTLKHIVGLLEPDAGEVITNSDHIGYLFQSGALLAWKTVWENVALPLEEATSLSDEEIDFKVKDALTAVGMLDAADKYPSEISGGMQKRAGLARSIVCDADVILYDEPTSGLDPVTSASISKLICEINRSREVTSVVVTHDIANALQIADKIMMLKNGKQVICASPDEFAKAELPEVRELLSAMKGSLR